MRIVVRLGPCGGRDGIDGGANAALIALPARELGVARSSLAIVGGRKARLKTVIASGDTSLLAARLDGLGEAK